VCNADETCLEGLEYGVEKWEAEHSTDSTDERKVRRLRTPSTLADYPVRSGLYMYGTDTTSSSWPVYCDYYHLYSFGFEHVTPQGDSDSATDLDV